MIKNYKILGNVWKYCNNAFLFRMFSGSSEIKRICIIGSGPAGMYTAQQILKSNHMEVDIFEKFPVPFGLLRYGVAPDHPEIRTVSKFYTKTALLDRCNFYGNINVSVDVSISEILDSYHAVVVAYGASYDKTLGIPGEDSGNVFPARKFVGWYTGHPEYANEKVDLDTEVATVVGHGNVAVDIVRMLLKNPDELKSTDISERAYDVLKKSRIKRVVMAGRRGPLQAAFTLKEIREIHHLEGVHAAIADPIVHQIVQEVPKIPILQAKLFKLLRTIYEEHNSGALSPETWRRWLDMKFLRTPKEIIPGPDGKVARIIFNVNKMKYFHDPKSTNVEVTDEEDIVDCGLVVRSVGYKGCSIDPLIPFDEKENRIPNQLGRVLNREGIYCSGWLKSGPTGVIIRTMDQSYETGDTVMKDLRDGVLTREPPKHRDDLFHLLQSRGLKVTTFKDWQKIDKFEKEKGKSLGKNREKFYSVEEMLRFIEN